MGVPVSPLRGRIAVISGAGTGIGAAAVRRFAEAGATIVAVGRSGAERVIAHDVGDQVIPFHADVTEIDDLESLFTMVGDRFGLLDVLYNNAGTAGPGDSRHADIDRMPPEQMELMWRTNLRAQALCMKLAVPLLKKAAGGGSIINTASIAAFVRHPFMTPYAASKAALLGLTRSSAAELGRYGIRVNAIVPGQIETRQLTDHLSEERLAALADTTALKRRGTPDEVARVAVFLASDASSYVTGTALVVDGGRSL